MDIRTPNCDLILTAENDKEKSFLDWRKGLDGTVGSNMLKIDGAIGGLDEGKVAKIPGKGLSSTDVTQVEKNLWNDTNTALGTKVDKVSEKQLSTNDYTTAEKTKLEGVAVGANNYVHPDSATVRHVSDAEKETWNGKQGAGNYVTQDNAGNVAITGNLTLKGTSNFGNKINFGDGDYVCIHEKTDDKLEIKGSGIDLVGVVTVNGKKVATESVAVNVILTVAGWSGSAVPYTQTVSVAGVTASNNIFVGLSGTATMAEVEEASAAVVIATGQASNSLTIKAYGDKPAISIPIAVLILS